MSKRFDAATKQLVETRPADWLAFLGLPGTGASVVDADLSTVTAEADRVVRVDNGPLPYLLHVEFQASYDPEMFYCTTATICPCKASSFCCGKKRTGRS